MRLPRAAAPALALCTTACAAVLGSHQKTFDLQSTPQSADVYVEGNRLGATPLRVKLDNHKNYTFVFRKEGYKDASCSLNKATGGGWVIFDVLTGLVPIVIDAATNSWSQTQGSHCTGSLEELPVTSQFSRASAPAPHLEDAPAPQTLSPVPTPEPDQRPVAPALPGAIRYVEVPPGTRYVADTEKKLYYMVGCVDRIERIPPGNRYYYQSEAAAQADGYRRDPDC
jgi:PEGA domain